MEDIPRPSKLCLISHAERNNLLRFSHKLSRRQKYCEGDTNGPARLFRLQLALHCQATDFVKSMDARLTKCYATSVRVIRTIFLVMGTLLAILSVVSLIQRWGDISMAEITGDALETYRAMLSAIRWIILDWWLPFSFPLWIMDIVVVWLLCITTNLRSAFNDELGHFSELPMKSKIDNIIYAPLVTLIFMAIPVAAIFDHWARIQRISEGEKKMFTEMLPWLYGVPIGVPAFFIWNAIKI